LDTIEIHHRTKDSDSIIPKTDHQDLEEVSEKETQEDHQKDYQEGVQEDH